MPDEAGQELHPAFDVKKSILSARILRQEYSSPRPADRLMANVILPAERGPEYLPSLDGQQEAPAARANPVASVMSWKTFSS